MKLRKLGTLFCLAMLAATSTSAWAETWHTARIKSVYPLANGSVVLIFVEDAPACPGSVPGKYHYISVGENGVTAEGVKMLMATALVALAMDKTVSVAFAEGSSGCYINRLITRD
jgi:hypothetical protein